MGMTIGYALSGLVADGVRRPPGSRATCSPYALAVRDRTFTDRRAAGTRHRRTGDQGSNTTLPARLRASANTSAVETSLSG